MKRKPNKKKIILAVTAVALVAAIGLGVGFGVGGSGKEPVKVFPFRYIGMTEYWGDSQESYGPVTTDKIQTVYLSSTQTVTEIKVAQGDTVKKGDLLMTFDTTLSDLALERKRLEVEKLKLDLENAKKKLREIRNMKPMVIPDYSDTDDTGEDNTNKGTGLTEAYRLSTNKAYDGHSPETALICWLHSSTAVDSNVLEAVRLQAEKFQNLNYVPEPTENPDEPTETTGETSETTQATEADQQISGEPSSASGDTDSPISVSSYYVVFKVTEGNMSLGDREVWQGLHVYGQGGGFRFQFFNPAIPDHTVVTSGEDDPADPDMPQIDFGSGYTAAQLAEMRSDQEKRIKDLQFSIKMAEADYKIMQTEVSDGNVYAEIDGEVVSVLTEEEAKLQNQPIVKVSGGGGFYIQGSISELAKESLAIGQEVTVNDWSSGMTYSGTVVSIGGFPTGGDGWNGTGNPNASYYPFTVFVDESADLQAGMYANIQYSAASSENGIYLENPFVRTEKGSAYVYVQGGNGKLEKRQVTTGKSLWGSYTEILSGLTEDDLIAFPYGKNLKEGASTVESDLRSLYE